MNYLGKQNKKLETFLLNYLLLVNYLTIVFVYGFVNTHLTKNHAHFTFSKNAYIIWGGGHSAYLPPRGPFTRPGYTTDYTHKRRSRAQEIS